MDKMGKFFYIKTRECVPSLGFREGTEEVMLHSSYHPKREARNFIEARKHKIQNARNIFVYGIGLGYHLIELENYRNPDSKVFVAEMNPEILPYTVEFFSFEKFIEKGYNFCITNNLQQIKSFMHTTLSKFDLEKDLLLIHPPSLRIVPDKCTAIRYLLEEWEVNRDSCQRRTELLDKNLLGNIKNYKNYALIDSFEDKFYDIPMIIVSAGPSLVKNKHLLNQAKGKSLIIAVGSVVKPLLASNIYPDCVVISDPLPEVSQQVEGINLNIPLFFLPTIQPEIANNYVGPKVMLLQKGMTLNEKIAQNNKCHLIETGGSVATTALEIALYFGGNPIIFVGQDLAYTNGKTHVPGTTHEPWTPQMNARLRLVPGVDGGLVSTSNNLSVYKRWIERKIVKNPEKKFINATEGGANILGTIISPFANVLQKLYITYPIEQIFKEVLDGYDI